MAVTAPADRRFRRAHVKPARRRRVWPGRLAGLARAAAAAAVVGGAGYYVAHAAAEAHALQVSTIRVRGNHRLSEGEILALVEGLRGQHILLADLGGWRRRLLGSPWVEDAALRRVLPSTVEVEIRERRPTALARLGGVLYLVDGQGLVIDEYGPNYAELDLPIVDGLDDHRPTGDAAVDPARAALAARVIADIGASPDVLQRVSQIDVGNPNDAVLTLDTDTAVVHVGDERFLERLQTYFGLAEALHARIPDIAYVDLRFADRVYVRPASGPTRHAAPRPAGPAVRD
jgi:cell division protein FtsQ